MSISRFAVAMIAAVVLIFPAVAQEPKAKPPALDRYLSPLPDGAVARLGLLRDVSSYSGPHKCSLALSPDGKTLALVDARVVMILDLPSGKVVRRILADDLHIVSLEFAGNSTLCVIGLRSLKLFDVSKGTVVRSVDIDPERVGIAFSRSAGLLATSGPYPAGKPSRLRVWDLATGGQVYDDPDETYTDVFFSTGDRFVVASRRDRKGKDQHV